MSHSYDYDVLILGGGPAGASAVSICAWLGKRVCVIEPRGCLYPAPTGAVSKILRMCGILHGNVFGEKVVPWSTVKEYLHATVDRVQRLPLPHDSASVDGLTVLQGSAQFVDPHCVKILNDSPQDFEKTVSADVIICATGSTAAKLPRVPFDGRFVFHSDDIVQINRTPHKILILRRRNHWRRIRLYFSLFGS